jgi:hypothetical protein
VAVSGEEAADVHALVDRVLADPRALLEGILQQAMEQLFQDDGLNGSGGRAPEELIATVLGNRVAQIMVNQDRSAAEDVGATNRPDVASDHERLVARNGELAEALGACDCWGENGDCQFCGGDGIPGWILPDTRLFATYARPAVRAVTAFRASSVGMGRMSENQRKEDGGPGVRHPSVRAVP